MNKRFRAAVLVVSVAAANVFGVTPANAAPTTYYCQNQDTTNYPTLRNFLTHSLTIATFAEATGIYDCGL